MDMQEVLPLAVDELMTSPQLSYLQVLVACQYPCLASSPGSPIFSTHAREKRGSLGSNVTCVTWAHILG